MEQIFSARKNYDLRRLLGGVDQFIDRLLESLETDPCYYLGAVRCLPLDASVRDLVAATIAQHIKIKVNLNKFWMTCWLDQVPERQDVMDFWVIFLIAKKTF